MMKKILALVFASLMILSLAACGSKPAAEPAPVEPAAPAESTAPAEDAAPSEEAPAADAAPATLNGYGITVGAFIYKFDYTFMTGVRNNMTAQAESLGATIELSLIHISAGTRGSSTSKSTSASARGRAGGSSTRRPGSASTRAAT